MQKNERDLLEVLKSELQFLEEGGYGRSPRTPWRLSISLKTLPLAMNFDSKENPSACSDCVLMALSASRAPLRKDSMPPHSIRCIG